MALDYGLLQGIGEGLTKGVEAYQRGSELSMKKREQENLAKFRELQEKRKRLMDQAKMAEAGFEEDPETGGVRRTAQAEEEKKQDREAKLRERQLKQYSDIAKIQGEYGFKPKFSPDGQIIGYTEPEGGAFLSRRQLDTMVKQNQILRDQQMLEDRKANAARENIKIQSDLAGKGLVPIYGQGGVVSGIEPKSIEEARKRKQLEAEANAAAKKQMAYNAGLTAQEKGLSIQQKRAQLPYETLPQEKQEIVKDVAKSIANRQKARSGLDAIKRVVADESIPYDQRLQTAMASLKQLNSEVGNDAVAAEEASRLSSLLDFHLLNLTKPGPVFGRADLKEFADQLGISDARIKGAIENDQKVIDEAYGRKYVNRGEAAGLLREAAKSARESEKKRGLIGTTPFNVPKAKSPKKSINEMSNDELKKYIESGGKL